ncbi:YugN-like family protein [Mesobacillus foraminis]|uniref:YugN-like family protein n=1 Tax=Mesobacillus foraminis TaxID=279826 RepID=UPI0039A1DBF0
MIEMPSQIEGKEFGLYQLEQKLKPMGYSIGGNWEYDQGYFDYKIADDNGYQYLRLPFEAVDGQLDSKGCTVKLMRPFLLSHVFEGGLDDHSNISNISAAFNQFQEPDQKDGKVPNHYIEIGKSLIKETESALL